MKNYDFALGINRDEAKSCHLGTGRGGPEVWLVFHSSVTKNTFVSKSDFMRHVRIFYIRGIKRRHKTSYNEPLSSRKNRYIQATLLA